VDVLDLEAQLGRAARRGARGGEDVELRGPTDVAQPTFTLFDRLEAESVAIEAPRAVEVLCGKLGHGVRRGEWTCHDWTSFGWFSGSGPVSRRKLIAAVAVLGLGVCHSVRGSTVEGRGWLVGF